MNLTTDELTLLCLIRSGVRNLPALAKSIGVVKSTAHKRVEGLRQKQLILPSTGKKNSLTLTSWGKESIKSIALIQEGGEYKIGEIECSE